MIRLNGDGASVALNRLAREKVKERLLADIATDLMICKLEGWNHYEYIGELRELIKSLPRK